MDYLQARLYFQRQEWGEAGRLLKKNRGEWSVLNIPRREAQANLLLGQCYEQIGNPDEALAAYQQSLKLEPASLTARRAVAATLLALGRSDEALAEYRQMLAFAKRPIDTRVLVVRLLINAVALWLTTLLVAGVQVVPIAPLGSDPAAESGARN